MIDIIGAKFILSSPNLKLSQDLDPKPEVVFIARSNSGKSSLLNALTNQKNLAKVSSTPGKTRLINFFDVEFLDREDASRHQARFVDLPGFGYAKVSKSLQEEWGRELNEFLLRRDEIKLFLHLVDARHPDLAIDKEVALYLEEIKRQNQTVLRVFTKLDKLNQKEISALKREFPDALMVSSVKRRGISELIKLIYHNIKEDQ